MKDIHLEAGLDVDDEQLKVFEDKVKFVFAKFKKHIILADLMGYDKGNWSHYMSGDNNITSAFIAEFENIFKHILEKHSQKLSANSAGHYPIEEPKSTFQIIEKKLTDLAENAEKIASGQQRLEAKLDTLIEKKP